MYFFSFKSPLNIDMWFYDKLDDDTSYFASQYLLRDRHKEGRKKQEKKPSKIYNLLSPSPSTHTRTPLCMCFCTAVGWNNLLYQSKK
jgi:hypothetical protein